MTNAEVKQAQQKKEAWERVRGLLLQAVGHLYTVDEGPLDQATLLDLADKCKVQAQLLTLLISAMCRHSSGT